MDFFRLVLFFVRYFIINEIFSFSSFLRPIFFIIYFFHYGFFFIILIFVLAYFFLHIWFNGFISLSLSFGLFFLIKYSIFPFNNFSSYKIKFNLKISDKLIHILIKISYKIFQILRVQFICDEFYTFIVIYIEIFFFIIR